MRTYQELIKGNIYKDSNDQYYVFTANFRQVLDKHAPLKRKKIRGNQTLFTAKLSSHNN